MEPPINLRGEGRARVLRALHREGATSRPRLVKLTGLSRATVASLIVDLLDEGLVQEHDGLRDEDARSGRPPQRLSVVPKAAYAAAADIGHQHVHVMLSDLSGEPLWDHRLEHDTNTDPRLTLGAISDLLLTACRDNGISIDSVLGIGVGIACPVDRTGNLLARGIMSNWVDVKPDDVLAELTGINAVVVNDANAGALGERLYGAGQGVDDLIYIRLSAGVGAGIISGGRLITGFAGRAGEIGHHQVDPDGLLCRCGNRGCLETVASTSAVADLLSRSWNRPVTELELQELIADGHPGVDTILRQIGDLIGRVVVDIMAVTDPRLVIVGGDLARAGDGLLFFVQSAIDRHAIPAQRGSVLAVRAALSPCSEVRGATGIILNSAADALATGVRMPRPS